MTTRVTIAYVLIVALAGAACADKYAEGDTDAPDAAADAGVIAEPGDAEVVKDAGPSDALDDGPIGNRCAELPDAASASPVCNGDYGSSASAPCPVDRQICSELGTCLDTCSTHNILTCTRAPGHPGTSCETHVGDGSGRCGAACVDGGCPAGRVCDTGIGMTGNVCIVPLGNGETFGTVIDFKSSCSMRGASACASGHGSTLPGSPIAACICGALAGAACSVDEDCADLHCDADKRCGRKVGDLCSPSSTDPAVSGGASFSACRSGKCGSDCTCEAACATDADCGGPLSGVICSGDSKCVSGCRVGASSSAGNGCPYGQSCTVDAGSVGTCHSN